MARRVVILADESASWKIAGLRQLERVALEASMPDETTELCILWRPDLPPEQRFRPQHPRLSQVEITTTPPGSADLLLSTHLFLDRNTVPSQLPAGSRPGHDLQRKFAELANAVRATWQNTQPNDRWEYLENHAQSNACEKRFLRGRGKSQDGLVSRFINRPISRSISRLLLKTPITPSAWTLAIFVLPLIGAVFLARGDYVSVVAGLLLFQIYSILDGCDGEIARAKYLESQRGRQLDDWCDILGNLLLVVSLGYGLSLQPQFGSFYFVEGIIVAILIMANELLLLFPAPITTKTDSVLYPRHQAMVERSGLLFFGERFVWWLMQLTKHDVALLAFFLLAMAGGPGWILHLLGVVAAISSLLALESLARAPRGSKIDA
jgi:phosphatidylglycerophosphate synthase